MLANVRKEINEFDPLNLLPYAPCDEYEKEINEINLFLKYNADCDVSILASEIYNIFKRTLGEDVFNKTIEDCYHVASNILLKTGV